MDLTAIQAQLREFARERDLERFHSPKNLAAALSVEAAELLEIFQWMTEDESRNVGASDETMEQVRHEMADVLLYLLRLADLMEVDLERAAVAKIELNREKYPVEKARGKAVKYHRLE